MLKQQNSTPAPTGATALQAMIDDRAGLLAQAVRARHLCRVLTNDLEVKLNFARACRTDETTVTLMFQKDGIDTVLWLMSELWEATHAAAEFVDQASDLVNELVEAGK